VDPVKHAQGNHRGVQVNLIDIGMEDHSS
jgi:hypothetical protein